MGEESRTERQWKDPDVLKAPKREPVQEAPAPTRCAADDCPSPGFRGEELKFPGHARTPSGPMHFPCYSRRYGAKPPRDGDWHVGPKDQIDHRR